MRTTEQAVRDILQKDYDCGNAAPLTPYIESVIPTIDRLIACATKKGKAYTPSELELLERWLGAHAYGMSDKSYTQRSNLRASGSFEGQTGMGLEGTRYGQFALDMLDPFGCLEQLNTKARTQVFWGGKRRSEKTDFEDRQ